MNKQTVIGIIPSRTNVTQLSTVLTQLEQSFGAFNCEISENYALLTIKYGIPEEQVQETMQICKNHCCTAIIIVSQKESKCIKDNHIELP